MAENERQQRLIERVQEDERLRGDLGGQAASALVEWATTRTRVATADASLPDHDAEAAALAIRAAARDAANSGLTAIHEIIARADASLAQHATALPAPAAPAPPEPSAAPAPPEPTPPKPAPAAPPRWFGRVRRRVGERIRHWFIRKES